MQNKHLHGPYGDSVIPRTLPEINDSSGPSDSEDPQKAKAKTPMGGKSNVQIYLKKIKEPVFSSNLRRKGCSGWPCNHGFLCDFCLLRPEWLAEAKIPPMQEEIDALRQTVVTLRKQQSDVDTLHKAERLVAGQYWSALDDNRIGTLNSLLEDSKARLEAQEAIRERRAAETTRDAVLQQLAVMQEKLDQKDRDVTESRQHVEALSESLKDTQRQLKFVSSELETKRLMIADSMKEKGRAGHEVTRLKTLLSAQETELSIRAEQVKALIIEVQGLQEIETERDRFRALAEKRAEFAQGIVEQVQEDIVMAERIRDEHSHQLKKMGKETDKMKKTLLSQNNQMARLRTELTEARSTIHSFAHDESPLAAAHGRQHHHKGSSRNLVSKTSFESIKSVSSLGSFELKPADTDHPSDPEAIMRRKESFRKSRAHDSLGNESFESSVSR